MKAIYQPKVEFTCDRCGKRKIIEGAPSSPPDDWSELRWTAPKATTIGTRSFDSGVRHFCDECSPKVISAIGG